MHLALRSNAPVCDILHAHASLSTHCLVSAELASVREAIICRVYRPLASILSSSACVRKIPHCAVSPAGILLTLHINISHAKVRKAEIGVPVCYSHCRFQPFQHRRLTRRETESAQKVKSTSERGHYSSQLTDSHSHIRNYFYLLSSIFEF